MRAILAILVVSLVAKDLAYVPFPYVLRASSQALCLIVGIAAVLPALSGAQLSRYWPIAAYLAVLVATAPFTQAPFFVLLQIGSLASAIIFAMGYFDRQGENLEAKLAWLVLWVTVVYGVVCLACLVLIRVAPGQAYENMFIGDAEGFEARFRGLFSKSAQMAAAGGLLAGLALMRVKRMPLKLFLAVIGGACLILPQCRSFWVAAFVAGGATVWLYYKSLRKWVVVGGFVSAVALILILAFGLSVNTKGVETFSRLDTVSTLTGRTALWQAAARGWAQKPLLGYGFTLGGAGLDSGASLTPTPPQELSRRTLHSGYVQSLLDSGVIGFALYLLTIFIAIFRAWRCDRERKYPEVLYVLLFLCISNGGESVIYSGAVFQSLCFWIFAAFALGLKSRHPRPATRAVPARTQQRRQPTFPANIMR